MCLLTLWLAVAAALKDIPACSDPDDTYEVLIMSPDATIICYTICDPAGDAAMVLIQQD